MTDPTKDSRAEKLEAERWERLYREIRSLPLRFFFWNLLLGGAVILLVLYLRALFHI